MYDLIIHRKFDKQNILALLKESRLCASYTQNFKYWQCSEIFVTPEFIQAIKYDVWPENADEKTILNYYKD